MSTVPAATVDDASSASSTPLPDVVPGIDDRRIELEPAQERHLQLLKQVLTASLFPESSWRRIEREDGGTHRSGGSLRQRSRRAIRHRVVEAFDRRGISLMRREPFDLQRREQGLDQPLFGYSMAGHRRMDNVRRCVEDVLVRGIPGDLLEAGAWRGGMTIWMRALLAEFGAADRTVWVADSFEGLPPAESAQDGPDLSHVELLKVGLETVQENFRRFGLLDEQVRFLPGWFKDTLPSAPVERIAILRLDGDMYHSTMDTLVPLYDRVQPGGWIIVDDYFSWESCRAAVGDFLAGRGLSPEIHRIDWTGACWRKA